MQEVCMFEIMDLPAESLKRVLAKAPARVLARLMAAYPRVVTRPFLDLLSECLSQSTLALLQEEIMATKLPSFGHIRQAEQELLKIMHEEKIVPPLAAAPVK